MPRRIADEVARYTDFRGHRFVDWHPLRSEMLVSTRKAGGDTTQIFRLAAPLAEPEQLTDFSEPVRTASYEPTRGDYIVFERSTGGDEAAQLYRLDLATRQTTLLTPPGQRHNMQEWLHRSSRLLYLSLPLDRTAPGGSRNEVTQTLSLVDPLQPQAQRRLAELPGGGWASELGRLGRFADRAHPLPVGRRVARCGCSISRAARAGRSCRRPGRRRRATSPTSGSATARASSSSATAPASFAS